MSTIDGARGTDTTPARPVRLDPGSTIGIVGGGQLGRMLALEARRMGYRTAVVDPTEGAPAAQVADAQIVAPLDDASAIRELAARADVITVEWENADPDLLEAVARSVPVRPSPAVLRICRNRLREKRFCDQSGAPVAPFRPVESEEALHTALDEIGVPARLKTTEGGYDGKGQTRIDRAADAGEAFRSLGEGTVELILEAEVSLRAEVSVVLARSPNGEHAAFPVGRNDHVDGILDVTTVPSGQSREVEGEAVRLATLLAESMGLEGLFAVEMFVTREGRLLVNEIAPRPHNSGHYTWEACPVSQFEQQLRAICGLPLGATDLLRPVAMANLLGRHLAPAVRETWPRIPYPDPAVALHLYGKSEPRNLRKVGHFTALGETTDEARASVVEARQSVGADSREGTRDVSETGHRPHDGAPTESERGW